MQTKKLSIVAAGAGVAVIAGMSSLFFMTSSHAQDQSASERPDVIGLVAEKVELDRDTLCNAFKETHLELLEDRAQERGLTDEEVAKIQDRIESSNCEGPMGKETRKRGDHAQGRGDKTRVIKNMAAFLGISEDELKEALKEGKRPHEILEEQGKSMDDFREYIREQRSNLQQ